MTPTWVEPTAKFDQIADELADALGETDGNLLIDQIADAIAALDNYAWDGSLPVTALGVYGDRFYIPLALGFALVFRRITDRKGEGAVIRSRVQLLTVEALPE